MAGKKVPDGYELVPPDGGFGWLVLFGCVLIGLIISVPMQALGLMFPEIIEDLQTTTAVAGWIPAAVVAAAQIIAPFNAILIDMYSPRVSTLSGGVLVSGGLILSFFANSIELYITLAGFIGAGLGMITNASYIILSQYFRNRYGVVTGITMASYSAGKFIFTPVIQLMLDKYDYRGVFLILGGMNLNIFVGAALFQNAKDHYVLKPINASEELPGTSKKQNKKSSKNLSDETRSRKPVLLTSTSNLNNKAIEKDCEAASTLLSNKTIPLKSLIDEQNRKSSLTGQFCSMETLPLALPANCELMTKQSSKSNFDVKESDETTTECCSTGPLKSLKFSQLKQPLFYIFLLSGFLGYLSSVYFGVFLPSLALENGLKPMDAALIMSARSAAEIAGRLTSPWIQNYFHLRLLIYYVCLAVAQGITVVILVFTYSLAGMTSVTILTGLFYGGHTSLSMLVIVASAGQKNLSAVLALSQFLQGILSLPVGPLIGVLKDFVGTFDICFYAIAVMLFLIAGVWMLEPMAKKRSKY